MNSTPQDNIPGRWESIGATAAEFFTRLRPGGPWLLTAIVPDGDIRSAWCTHEDQIRRFVAKHNGRRNLYYSLNPPKPEVKERVESHPNLRAKKEHIARAEFVHADLDPRDDETPEEAKARYLEKLKELGRTPAFVVDSGNGLQVLWRLDEAVEPERFAEVEAASLAATRALGGTDGTQDVSRILRVPGTTNLPNAKKRQAGRVPCEARLIRHDDIALPLTLFRTEKRAAPPLEEVIRSGCYNHFKDDRSRAVWAVVRECVRQGWPDERIAATILDPENKISEHVRAQSNPRKYAERQVAKAREAVRKEKRGPTAADKPTEVVMTRLSDVEPEAVEWLWRGRFAIGKFSMIAGDPGLSKSTLAIDMAARVSRGAPWPFKEDGHAPLGNVIIFSAEDSPKDTILPRLMLARGDRERVFLMEAAKSGDGTLLGLDLTRDIELIERKIEEIGDVKLIIFDPISAYLGKLDSHRNTEVRAALMPLSDMAERQRVALVAITHLTKGDSGGKQLMRVMGSVAFTAASRSTWGVIRESDIQDDDDDMPPSDRRLLLSGKNNLGPERNGLAYEIVVEPVPGHPDITNTRIEFDPDPVNLTLEDAAALAKKKGKAPEGKAPSKLDEAIDWLRHILSQDRLVAMVQEEARAAGIALRTLDNARRELGVEPEKRGDVWWLKRLKREDELI